MSTYIILLNLSMYFLTSLLASPFLSQVSSFPPSPLIEKIEFDMTTLDQRAPGSDNWPVTWAADNNQYTSWGDGGGFGGTNDSGRVSLGFARIEGSADNYKTINTWGGYGRPEPPCGGKSYGILALGDTLYMWRSGEASDETTFEFQELYKSLDKGKSWQLTDVRFSRDDFQKSKGLFTPTFLQFGRGYRDARDRFIYIYAPEIKNDQWNVQFPGEISLMRVDRKKLEEKNEYRFYSGTDNTGNPVWSPDIEKRRPVFSDSNGVMRTAVNFNKGLNRYFLLTQQIDRFREFNGHIGIYDSASPWGPWTTVLFANAFDIGLVDFSKTVFFNFSNKWSSPDGKNFVMVYTNKDNWATVEGRFILREIEK